MIDNKKLIVSIPALNEEANIEKVIKSIPDIVDIIIVINDGSKDKTEEIALKCGAVVVNHPTNKGVGAAFHSAVKKALELGADILVTIDADGQFDTNDIPKLSKPISIGQADFVTASRFKDKTLYPIMPKSKFYGNIFMASFISKLTRQKFYDVSCGFRAYNKEALLRLNLFGQFTYTQETFIDLAFKKMVILEVPSKVRGVREIGKSRVASNLFKYALQTSKIIIRTYRDYKPFKLFGFLSLIMLIIGFGMGGFVFTHFALSGSFTPYKWLGFTGGFFIGIGLVFLLLGFILDMFTRMRINQEELLYQNKKQMY